MNLQDIVSIKDLKTFVSVPVCGVTPSNVSSRVLFAVQAVPARSLMFTQLSFQSRHVWAAHCLAVPAPPEADPPEPPQAAAIAAAAAAACSAQGGCLGRVSCAPCYLQVCTSVMLSHLLQRT